MHVGELYNPNGVWFQFFVACVCHDFHSNLLGICASNGMWMVLAKCMETAKSMLCTVVDTVSLKADEKNGDQSFVAQKLCEMARVQGMEGQMNGDTRKLKNEDDGSKGGMKTTRRK